MEKVPVSVRADYWSDVVGGSITEIRTLPCDNGNFQARLKVAEYGCFTIAEAISTPAKIEHLGKARQPGGEDSFVLHLQTEGLSRNCQSGREGYLKKGDYLLCDTARPFEVSFSSSNRMFAIRVPKKELALRLPFVEDLVCLPQHGNSGVSGMVSQLITSIWWQLGEQGQEQDGVKRRVCDSVLDLLASSYIERYQSVLDEVSSTRSCRWKIQNYIEQHLQSPELSIKNISQSLGYSVGYLHQIFRGEGESISQYISRRRLEKAANCLTGKVFSSRSVSEIGFMYGFNSGSHFGRAFKEAYGITPKQYREGHLDQF